LKAVCVRCGGLAWRYRVGLDQEVNLRRARLVLGSVTMFRFISWCGTFISVCHQSPRSTQPGYPFMDRCNEYQMKTNIWALWR